VKHLCTIQQNKADRSAEGWGSADSICFDESLEASCRQLGRLKRKDVSSWRTHPYAPVTVSSVTA